MRDGTSSVIRYRPVSQGLVSVTLIREGMLSGMEMLDLRALPRGDPQAPGIKSQGVGFRPERCSRAPALPEAALAARVTGRGGAGGGGAMDLEEAVSRQRAGQSAGRVPTAGREGTEAAERRLQDADSLSLAEGGRGGGMRGGERDAAGGRARSRSGARGWGSWQDEVVGKGRMRRCQPMGVCFGRRTKLWILWRGPHMAHPLSTGPPPTGSL